MMNTTKSQPLSIGQVAKQSRVGVETVRFYEKEGLLPKPARKASGYRQYTAATIQRILFIHKAKSLGFTLKEISELMNLRVSKGQTCAEVKLRAKEKIEVVNHKLRELQQVRDALEALVRSCQGRGPTSECPLLETLSQHGDDDV